MIVVRCTYGNGDTVTTRINATLYEARAYFLGQWFNLGTVEDNMQQCVNVEQVVTTTRVSLPEGDGGLHPAKAELSLISDGASWRGTFALVALTLLEDLLSDGPLDVSVVVEGSGRTVERVTGRAAWVARDGDTPSLVFDDGAGVLIDDIEAIHVGEHG